MKQEQRLIIVILCLGVTLGFSAFAWATGAVATVHVKNFDDAKEAEALIAATRAMEPQKRIERISEYLLGRWYHPETKTRIKKERAKKGPKKEANNPDPIPVATFPTSLTYLDCMTYVEHVLALATAEKPDYRKAFLPRLIDITFNAGGKPLFSHLRNHFTSGWGDVNERKGYLVNVARGHPLARVRQVVLNKVGANRTAFVEDRFMIASGPQAVPYFPTAVILAGKAPLVSGDVLALATAKEGLDVTHMAFFIEKDGKRWFRHASLTKNRIVDEDFDTYIRGKKELLGLMVFRPVLKAPLPPYYWCEAREKRQPK